MGQRNISISALKLLHFS